MCCEINVVGGVVENELASLLAPRARILGGSAEFGAEPRHEPAKRGSISRNRRHKPHLRRCWCWFRGMACRNQKNALLKRPHLTTQHRAAATQSVHRHTPPRQRGHATGPVSAHRRDGILRAAIYERGWHPSCMLHRSSFVVVVNGARTFV